MNLTSIIQGLDRLANVTCVAQEACKNQSNGSNLVLLCSVAVLAHSSLTELQTDLDRTFQTIQASKYPGKETRLLLLLFQETKNLFDSQIIPNIQRISSEKKEKSDISYEKHARIIQSLEALLQRKTELLERIVNKATRASITFGRGHKDDLDYLSGAKINGSLYEAIQVLGAGLFGTTIRIDPMVPSASESLVLKISNFNKDAEMNERKSLGWDTLSDEVSILKMLGRYRGHGIVSDRWFLASSYIKGYTFPTILKKCGTVAQMDVVSYLEAIMDAYEKLGKLSVVHGDIHFGNLLFFSKFSRNLCNGKDIEAEFIDFGNARNSDNPTIVKKDLCGVSKLRLEAFFLYTYYRVKELSFNHFSDSNGYFEGVRSLEQDMHTYCGISVNLEDAFSDYQIKMSLKNNFY